ncbi:MAG: hypothetical protein WCO63_14515 [Bacteroidota bacterium]
MELFSSQAIQSGVGKLLSSNDICAYMVKKLSFFFLLILTTNLFAQRNSNFSLAEDSLKHLSHQILSAPEEFVRYDAAKRFDSLMFETLSNPDSWDYSFDSLKSVSKLVSDDEVFRIFTWGIPKQDGTYEYAGILQLRQDKKKSRLFRLNDLSLEIKKPEEVILGPDNWYGAIYYKLITTSYNDMTYYTLLGWDACSVQTRRKVIDMVSFDSKGEVVFGAAIFTHFPRKVKRVLFEYSSKVSMTLNYSEQGIKEKTGTGKNVKTKESHKEMIVFDRLVPQDPQLEGIYAYYVPETNVNDGFLFEKGKWQFVKEVDARNPKHSGKPLPKSKQERDLLPPASPKK